MKKIVVMPGGFHPFHAGHYALYKSAVEAFPDADVYVAATNDQKARPFPFSIKEKLAKLAGVAPGRFIQVKSPFKANEITDHYDPNEDVLIFVRSEKDRTEQPKPGGTKKDGTPSYFQPWTGKNLQPFSKHAYIEYLPTVEFGPGIRSATEIRNAWPNLNDRQKTAMVMSLYPVTQKKPELAKNVVQMLDIGMSGQVDEASSPAQQAAIAISKKKHNNLSEDMNFAGLRTAGLMTLEPKIYDDSTNSYLKPDQFFAKYPQYNKEQWQQEYNQFIEKRSRARELEKSKTATDISGNPVTPEQAKKEQQDLLKLLTPEEQSLYKQLYKTDIIKAGRLLKQAWSRKVQQDQMKKLIKVHWTTRNNLDKFLNKKISNKAELSVVMYKSKDEIPSEASWGTSYDENIGLILDGWVTLAGGMDLSSDNQRVGKGETSARSDQKYSLIPGRIETDVNKMRTTKAELGGSWNEALIDNWRIMGFVAPAGMSNETLNMLSQTRLPIVDKRTSLSESTKNNPDYLDEN